MSLLPVLPVFLGLIVGLMLALSGAGGGIIAVPLLVSFLGLSIQQAAPIGLVAVGLSATLGASLAWRSGQLRYRAAGLIGLSGICTAPLGVLVANRLPSTPLLLGFSAILVGLAYQTLRNLRANNPGIKSSQIKFCKVTPTTGRFAWNKPCALALSITGAVSGFLSGLLGVGGGFVIIPALHRYSDLHAHSIIATVLGVIGLVALSGTAAALLHGTLDMHITLTFAGGALVGMLFGKILAVRAQARTLRFNFAWICLISAGLLIAQTGRLGHF